MSCAALYSPACVPVVDPGQQQPAECRPDLSSLEEAQLAELLVLLQQQGLPHQQQLTTPEPSEALLPSVDGEFGELLSAEQAIDAEISQLLALKQARLQQRRQNQLKLLQRLVAERTSVVVPASSGPLGNHSTALQPRDVAIQMEQLQHQLPSMSSFATSEASWSAQSQPASSCNSRTSIDLGCLQRGMTAVTVPSAFNSSQADALPAQVCSLAVQTPFSTPAGSFADPLHQQSILAGNVLAVDVNLHVSLAAALSSLSTQDSSSVLLSPQSTGTAALPSPAMRRIGSAGVLSAMAGPCLQDHAGQLSQQCGVSAMAGPACLVPVSDGYTSTMPSPAQALHAGRVMGAVGAGSYRAVPAHGASLSGAFAHAGTPVPEQARSRRHSIHLYPSAYTCAGLQLSIDAGSSLQLPNGVHAGNPVPEQVRSRRHSIHLHPSAYTCAGMQLGTDASSSLALPNGVGAAAYAPAAARSMRSGDPRVRRMSADVYSQGARQLLAPNSLAAAVQPHPMYADGSAYGGCRFGEMSRTPVSLGPATLSPAAGSACASAVGLAGKQSAQVGAREPARRRSFDARKGGAGARRKSVEMPTGCAAPSWAGPTWDSKRDVQCSAAVPAKKGTGTGVFMPRTAA